MIKTLNFLILLSLFACSSPPVTEITSDSVAGRWTDREEKNVWDFQTNGSATFVETIHEETYSNKVKSVRPELENSSRENPSSFRP